MATTTRVVTKGWYSGVTVTNTVYASDLTTVLRAARDMTEFPADSGSFVLIDTEWDTSWVNAIDVFSDGSLPAEIQAAAPIVTVATTSVAGIGRTIATLTTYDINGTVAAGVVIEYRIVSAGNVPGYSFPGTIANVTSDDNGLVSLTLTQGSTYEFRRDSGNWVQATMGKTGTDTLPEVLGRPGN